MKARHALGYLQALKELTSQAKVDSVSYNYIFVKIQIQPDTSPIMLRLVAHDDDELQAHARLSGHDTFTDGETSSSYTDAIVDALRRMLADTADVVASEARTLCGISAILPDADHPQTVYHFSAPNFDDEESE